MTTHVSILCCCCGGVSVARTHVGVTVMPVNAVRACCNNTCVCAVVASPSHLVTGLAATAHVCVCAAVASPVAPVLQRLAATRHTCVCVLLCGKPPSHRATRLAATAHLCVCVLLLARLWHSVTQAPLLQWHTCVVCAAAVSPATH